MGVNTPKLSSQQLNEAVRMKFCRGIGTTSEVVFVILAFAMGLWGSAALDYVQVLLIFSWMGMLVHQFEEYAWPGGFPLISNMIVFNEIERPDQAS